METLGCTATAPRLFLERCPCALKRGSIGHRLGRRISTRLDNL